MKIGWQYWQWKKIALWFSIFKLWLDAFLLDRIDVAARVWVTMKHTLPPLDSLKVFESAARHLSFTRAADELCITKGAVSYQIRRLEERLCVSLFKRGIRQVFLTDAGQLLYHSTERWFRELSDTVSKINRAGERYLSIAATTYVAARWLSPRIAGFTASYPDVSIVFHHTVNGPEFSLDTVDIAIRWQRCINCINCINSDDTDDHARGHEVTDSINDVGYLHEMPMSLYPVAAPSLVRDMQAKSNKELFKSQTLLCEERDLDLWREWDDGRGLINTCTRRVIADANVRVQAAIDGQGLILADELMRAELDSGVLIRTHEHQLDGYGYVIMSSPHRIAGSDAATLVSWLMVS
ncbi:MAG: DNA-binding transcriptional activator GcvA [marine bacterium B5-7]|nr:MAG: DNA-binding transcriptional activator GcvA [marine bacterium B5-7]